MDTKAGPIEFKGEAPMLKEKGDNGNNWYVSWTVKMIHPKMEEGSGITGETIPPKMGRILDRNGIELATTKKVREIAVRKTKFNTADLDKLANTIGLNKSTIESKLKGGSDYIALRLLTEEDYTPIKPVLTSIVGVEAAYRNVRYYPLGEAATNLVGYNNSFKNEITRLENQ
jgi:penicillin-binding protein